MQPPPNLPTAPTPNCLPATAILTSRQVCQIHFADPQRAVICPGPSFAGASLSGKLHLKTIHWVNRDFQNSTFLLKRTPRPVMCSKLCSMIVLNEHRLHQKCAQKFCVGWATCIAWSGRKLFGITFLIYIHALALVEHHPSFRPEFLPRLTVSNCVSHFPGRLYRICNWQMGVGRFLGFLQVLMAVQWLLGTIWWSGLAQRETQKHRNTKHRMAVQWILGTVWWSRLAHRETQKPKAKTGLIIK